MNCPKCKTQLKKGSYRIVETIRTSDADIRQCYCVICGEHFGTKTVVDTIKKGETKSSPLESKQFKIDRAICY